MTRFVIPSGGTDATVLGRRQHALACVALFVFSTQFVILDAALRGATRFRELRETPIGILELVASVMIWALLGLLSERKVVRGVVAFAASLILAVEIDFYRYYHSFLDLNAALAARRMWDDVSPVVRSVLPRALPFVLVVALAEYGCLSLAVRVSRWLENRRSRALGALGAASMLFLAIRADARTPDLSAIGALRALIIPVPKPAKGHVDVPKLQTKRARLPNVLLVLTESIRASDWCQNSGPECELAPQTAALVPDRVPLRQMRSIASYTALAVQSLLTSRLPSSSLEETLDAPLVFDFAKAIRKRDQRPQVVLWSAQSDSLFWREDVREVLDSVVTIDELFGRRIQKLDDIIDERADEMLAVEVDRRFPDAKRPMFLMLHLSGTHVPYFVDQKLAPYQPYQRVASWTGLDRMHNAYKNSILAQDQSTARMLRAFLKASANEPWFIVYTSDHGEAFGEHKAIHHGQNLYDEQIHVPGFVAWGNGALEPNEVAALRSHQDDFVTHLDVLPTLLDAFGVLDSFELEMFRKRFVGRSLLRKFEKTSPIPLTNCTGIFPCPLKTWGMLGDGHVLVAQPWDYDFRCVDLSSGEPKPLGDPACQVLRVESRAHFPTLPNGRANQ